MTSTLPLDVAAKAMREAMQDSVKHHTIWYLAQGALMVLAGVVALFYPLLSTSMIVVILGWLLIISGCAQGISLIGGQHLPHFWPQAVSIVLSIIVGVLFLRHPEAGLLALGLLLTVFFIVEGASKIIFALTIRPMPNWIWILVSGVVAVALGIYLATTPITAVWLFGLLIGVVLIGEGAALGYLAWQVRRAIANGTMT